MPLLTDRPCRAAHPPTEGVVLRPGPPAHTCIILVLLMAGSSTPASTLLRMTPASRSSPH